MLLGKGQEEKLREMIGRIPHKYDADYLRTRFLMTKRRNSLGKFVKNIFVLNPEKVKELKDKQIVCFSNHLSHFDYIALGYVMIDNQINLPRIAAGLNLDSLILRAIGWDFRKMGAFFIDREGIIRLKPRFRKRYLRYADRYVRESILRKGDSLLIFPEGKRNDKYNAMEHIRLGLLNCVADSGLNPFVVNAAIGYDKVIESDFFELINKYRGNKGLMYKLVDLRAFFSVYMHPESNCYLNFSSPVPLKDIARRNNGKELSDYVVNGVRALYEQIQEYKKQ